MEKPQPAIVIPKVRVPQVPPQQVAGIRRLYIPPTFKQVSTSLYRPASRPETQSRCEYVAPALKGPPVHRYPAIERQISPAPHRLITPAIRLPANLQKPPEWQEVPQTPGLLSFSNEIRQWSPITEMQPSIPKSPSQMQIPVTPAYSIPGYFATRFKREEPGLGETLLGCGMLLLMAVIVLGLLYYLAM